jgi:hypothetical protein
MLGESRESVALARGRAGGPNWSRREGLDIGLADYISSTRCKQAALEMLAASAARVAERARVVLEALGWSTGARAPRKKTLSDSI